MKCISLLLITGVLALASFGQNVSSRKETLTFINSLIRKNFYGVIKFKKPGGAFAYKDVPGMNINDKYFLTCYHLMLTSDSEKFVSMKLYYRNDYRRGRMDSLTLIKDAAQYKKILQSKRTYDQSDYSTDYILIPVKEKIKADKLNFDSTALRTGDTTYAMGSYLNKLMMSRFEVLYEDKACESCRAEFVFLLGPDRYGFPGSPVFNTDGSVVGMVQFAIEKDIEEFFYKKLKANKISFLQYRRIIKQYYGEGAKATCFIKINYLLKKLITERPDKR